MWDDDDDEKTTRTISSVTFIAFSRDRATDQPSIFIVSRAFFRMSKGRRSIRRRLLVWRVRAEGRTDSLSAYHECNFFYPNVDGRMTDSPRWRIHRRTMKVSFLLARALNFLFTVEITQNFLIFHKITIFAERGYNTTSIKWIEISFPLSLC